MINANAGIGVLPTNISNLLFDPSTGLLNQYLSYDLSKRTIDASANTTVPSTVNSVGGNSGVANANIPTTTTINNTTKIYGAIAIGLIALLILKK